MKKFSMAEELQSAHPAPVEAADEWQPMPEPVQVPEAVIKLGEPNAVWVYRNEQGVARGAIMRWDKGGQRKYIRPVIWNGDEYVVAGMGNHRPLLDADVLAAHPMAPVLIVEGEKSAAGANRFLPDGWVVTTWSGGSSAVAQTDWTTLKGRTCVMWPDNDEAGAKAATQIQELLAGMKSAVSIVALPEILPPKWDLGDDLPDDVSEDTIKQLIIHAAEAAVVPVPVVAAKPVAVAPVAAPKLKAVAGDILSANDTTPFDDDPDVDPHRIYKPLGYDHGTYYILTRKRQQVDEFTGDMLMSEKGLMKIHGDRSFWAEQQYNEKGRVDWVMAGVSVMSECEKVGVYHPMRIRGRGVWIDKDRAGVERVVVHTGRQLLISRKGSEMRPVEFMRFQSDWIYEASRELNLKSVEMDDDDTPLTDDEGRKIREMCQCIRWQSRIYADLFAGWMATAIICGGLDWRTHIWITGNHGSGKSTVVDDVVGAVLGYLAIYPQGNTTEAGIRSALRSDAMPVVFDESETDKNGRDAESRRQQVLTLMRMASSNKRGAIMKGSANHEVAEFAVRSSFLLSSIGVGLKQAADLSRVAVLNIRSLDSYPIDMKDELEVKWNRMRDIIAELDPGVPNRLLMRQARNLLTLKHNIKVFKEVLSERFSSPRIGDMLGTPLAGCFSLYSTKKVTPEMVQRYVEDYEDCWDEFLVSKGEREDKSILHHICSCMVRVETERGTQDRTIGELMAVVRYGVSKYSVNSEQAADVLQRHGIRIARENGEMFVYVSMRSDALSRLMQTSTFFEGWEKVLMRNPYAKKVDKRLSFAGVSTRVAQMPIQEWPIE